MRTTRPAAGRPVPLPGPVEAFDARFCPRCDRDLTDPLEAHSCFLCACIGLWEGRDHLIPAGAAQRLYGAAPIVRRLAAYLMRPGSRLFRRLVRRWTLRLLQEGLT